MLDIDTACAPKRAGLSRRTLVAGAAWSVPVVVGLAAVPAVAASSVPQASLMVQAVGAWGGGGGYPNGNFVVQASSTVNNDDRSITVAPTASLYRREQGAWVSVGVIPLSPASAIVGLDGGSQQFTFARGSESTPKLVSGTTYQVVVTAVATDSSGGSLTASNSTTFTAY